MAKIKFQFLKTAFYHQNHLKLNKHVFIFKKPRKPFWEIPFKVYNKCTETVQCPRNHK